MKRLLLLALTLAAAAMLSWLFARRAAPAPATPAPEVASAEADHGAQTSLSTPEAAAPRVAASGTAKVRGQVVLARTKRPVDGGEALLEYMPAGASRKRGDRARDVDLVQSASAPIDGEGRFALELPLGAQLISIYVEPPSSINEGDRHHPPPPKLRFESKSQHLHETVAAQGVELLVEVEPPVELRGLVRDAATQAPLEGARIRIPEASGMVAEAHSGADGRFVLSGIPPRNAAEHWSLRVDRRDHLASLARLTEEQLAPGAPELLVELARGLAVVGTVVDARNAPVAGLALRLRAVGFDKGLDLGASVVSTTTDADGEFRYAPVAPCNSLQVEIDAQRRNGLDFLAQRRDLGPLRSDRTDLQVVVQGCGILEVQARLASGVLLGAREFQLICTNGPSVEPAGSSAEGQLLRVPLGVELELEAYAGAGDGQEAGTFVRGRGRARLDKDGSAAGPLRIVVGEVGSFSAPPPKSDARELVLPDEPFLHATVDVQLLDEATGLPIRSGRRVAISGSGASLMSSKLDDGWLRVRGRPGRHEFEVEIEGGTHETREVVIPASGYGTAEWRVRAGP